MADRTCPRCGRTFELPCRLRSHAKRKTPCARILEPEDLPAAVRDDPAAREHQCRFCQRIFASYDSMRRHIRTACTIAPNARNGDEGMNYLYDYTVRKQGNSQETALQGQLTVLTQNVDMLARALQQVLGAESRLALPPGEGQRLPAAEMAIVGDNNVLLQDRRVAMNILQDRRVATTNIMINLFGHEKIDHVTRAKVRELLTESLSLPSLSEAAAMALIKAAFMVYSDPEHPENITCFLPNKREASALVHTTRPDGTRLWELQPVRVVAPLMALKCIDVLFDYQPLEDADDFGPLMKELRDNEDRYARGDDMRVILIRNKDLLTQALRTLPVAMQPD